LYRAARDLPPAHRDHPCPGPPSSNSRTSTRRRGSTRSPRP